MSMTRELKLAALLRLPWTVQMEHSEEGYFVARCTELPGSIATGSDSEIEREFWDSMRATLACLLDDGDAIPLPNGVRELPWERVPNPMRLVDLVDEYSVQTEAAGAVSRDLVAA